MGAKITTIGTIDKVIDHDCGNYRIGEIFNDPERMIELHVSQYGEYGFEQMRDYALRILEIATNAIKKKRSEEFPAGAGS